MELKMLLDRAAGFFLAEYRAQLSSVEPHSAECDSIRRSAAPAAAGEVRELWFRNCMDVDACVGDREVGAWILLRANRRRKRLAAVDRVASFGRAEEGIGPVDREKLDDGEHGGVRGAEAEVERGKRRHHGSS